MSADRCEVGDRVLVLQTEWGRFSGIIVEKPLRDIVIIRCDDTGERRGVSLDTCDLIMLEEGDKSQNR